MNAAITSAANETVDDALANGDISQDRADSLKDKIANSNGQVPFFGGGPGIGGGRGFRMGMGIGFFDADLLQTAADTLHVSTDDLKADLRSGKSLADVAVSRTWAWTR